MQSKEQVFLYMKEEIEKLAQEEEAKILEEAKKLEQEAYEKIKYEASQDAKSKLEKEMVEISSNASLEASSSLEERTKKLVEKRNDYVSTIFTEAKKGLMDFVVGDKYHDYLINGIKKASEEYQMTESVIYVRDADLSLKDEILKAYSLPVEVESNNDIEIGGFIIENKNTNVVVDESLDFALENQKDWFYKTSGLMIK